MTDIKPASHKIVCFGEILWDILPDKTLPGGAPMNVAYHLHKLGVDPVLLTRIGLDDRGKELLKILNKAGVSTSHIQLDYDLPTGVVHAQQDARGEMHYDIVSPSAWDHIAFEPEMESILKEADYFVFGSLVTRNPVSRNTLFTILEIAKNRVLDINLRQPFYNRSIVETLLGKADVLKMNLAELELITGWFADYKSTEERINLIQDKFNIRTIIVTMGGNGSVVNFRGKLYTHPGFKVKVSDTIGSGDSYLAAFLSKILEKASVEEALLFASGLGALVSSKPGGWPEYAISEINEMILAKGNTAKKN